MIRIGLLALLWLATLSASSAQDHTPGAKQQSLAFDIESAIDDLATTATGSAACSAFDEFSEHPTALADVPHNILEDVTKLIARDLGVEDGDDDQDSSAIDDQSAYVAFESEENRDISDEQDAASQDDGSEAENVPTGYFKRASSLLRRFARLASPLADNGVGDTEEEDD
ncbi:MAG: hypothetical protein MMC23_001647 [Stictis urceolatum]|nr:hypothetical protein [Stictis urceolata]